MKFSAATIATAALAGQAAAASVAHSHGLAKKHNHAVHHSQVMRAAATTTAVVEEKNETHALAARDLSALLGFGLKAAGLNPTSSTAGTPWLGSDGPYTNEFFNMASEDVFLVIWGVEGSWVNAVQPTITVLIPAGQSTTVSFPSGSTGAWAPLYPESKLVMGQISETWGEFTFTNLYSTVDVSREVNMNGRTMRIVTPQCTSDMETCVFVCPSGQTSCWMDYQLLNCAVGSQPGANFGEYYGAPSGGCSGMGNSANLQTFLGY